MATELSWDDLNASFATIDDEKQRREFVSVSPEVVRLGSANAEHEGNQWDRSSQHHFSVFIARGGSGQLEEVRAAITDSAAADALSSRMREKLAGRTRQLPSDAIKAMLSEPVFGEIRYAGSPIAQDLWVPDDLGLTVLVFPYEGGRLAPSAVRLAQWSKQGSGAKLEGLLAIPQTSPNEVEQAADRIFTFDAQPRVVQPHLRSTLAIAGTLAAGVTAAVWAAAFAGPAPGAFDIADLGDTILREVPDEPTLDEIVDARQRHSRRLP